jgi:hypothetical protein
LCLFLFADYFYFCISVLKILPSACNTVF